MLSVDAAIPDRSGGTTASTAALTATSASPRPKPTAASTAASAAKDGWGSSRRATPKIATPASRQPTAIGFRGPRAAIQMPAMRPAAIIASIIATNSSAIRQPEKLATTCR